MQRTISRPQTVKGVGLHGGQPATARLVPAAVNSGVTFVRTDLTDRDNVIEARFDAVSATTLCTELSNAAEAKIATVEHLMAALAGCGIDNLRVEIDGPEIPILDGSARDWIKPILAAHPVDQAEPLEAIRILKPVTVTDGEKTATLEPCDAFEVTFSIDFEDAAIGRQTRSEVFVGDTFLRDYANCRTFCSLSDVETMRKHGFARGGSLSNAIVVDEGRVLNRCGLRHRDEFVRHKMLDAVGDLFLAGSPIIGRYVGHRAGHDMTNRLLRALFADAQAWEYVPVIERATVLPDYLEPAPALKLACA